MSPQYSDPTREEDPHALPDVEVFYISVQDVIDADPDSWLGNAILADEATPTTARDLAGWYFWFCFPGCMPDSDPNGPYATELDAINAAQEE